ncbi:hypothetical protein D3C78_1543090 [compost metagenome]
MNKQPPKITDTSAASQRIRLLERLQAGPVSTFEAREELNIMMPAARVKELRDQGHPILTDRQTLTDPHGFKHAGVARYYLTEGSAA